MVHHARVVTHTSLGVRILLQREQRLGGLRRSQIEKDMTMTDIWPDEMWIFVVDTKEYAGNFGSEMCAYMTGCFDECGTGEEEAAAYRQDVGIDEDDNELHEHLIRLPDDKGYPRYANMWDTPGWFCDGEGNEWPEGTDPEKVRIAYEKVIDECYEEPERSEHKKKGPEKCIAYLSFAIHFDRELTPQELDVLMVRARKYTTLGKPLRPYSDEKITIKGFRLLHREVVTGCVQDWNAAGKPGVQF
jgi:hypothetical protein